MVGCYGDSDEREVIAVSTAGDGELWRDRWQNRFVWGWFDSAENGSRFVYESVAVSRPISTFDALYPEDVQAQIAGVYDTESGKLVLVRDASPVLTAGQNVALSPDGKRFAILRNGTIEVYDLPPVSVPPPRTPPEMVAKKKK
jgi:WD40 repeat protein